MSAFTPATSSIKKRLSLVDNFPLFLVAVFTLIVGLILGSFLQGISPTYEIEREIKRLEAEKKLAQKKHELRVQDALHQKSIDNKFQHEIKVLEVEQEKEVHELKKDAAVEEAKRNQAESRSKLQAKVLGEDL